MTILRRSILSIIARRLDIRILAFYEIHHLSEFGFNERHRHFAGNAGKTCNRLRCPVPTRRIALRLATVGAAVTGITSGISRAVRIGVTLIIIPLTLHYLGNERFGLWMTISSVLAMAGLRILELETAF